MSTKPGTPRASWRLAQAAAQIRRDLPLAVLDAALVGGGYLGVLVLRFEGAVPSEWWRPFGRFLPVAVLVHLVVNWVCGLYAQIWRHAGVKEARRVLLAGLVSTSVLGVLYLYSGRRVPLSLVVLGGAITTMLVGGLRFQSRLLAFRNGHDRRTATRVVVVGAGQSGAAIVREMLLRPEHGLAPVAVLDDDPRKQGRSLSGVPIIGGVDDLPASVTERHAEQALLAIPSADGELVRRVANAADAVGLTLKVLPSV
ncbi:MAG: hypothetical protein M3276_05805, partial [Actinomycetota bacterium]|nr:hypothetical protein [Actinomycetota bacterium]